MSEPKKRKLDESENRLFQLSVNSAGTVTAVIDPSFNIFPQNLLAFIRRQIESQYADIQNRRAVRPAGPLVIVTHEVRTTDWAWPYFASPSLHQRSTYRHVGLANLVALDVFRRETLERQDMVRTEWLQLVPQTAHVSNPTFDKLHSLRATDIGWGFDSNGCVSVSAIRPTGEHVFKSTAYVYKQVHLPQQAV
jgi:hypothetical protein